MSAGTLWTINSQFVAKPARAVAALTGLSIDIPSDYTHFQDNKKPEFTSKFPHGKIPAWEGKDGFIVFESIPIARYLASLAPGSGLLGKTATDAALVDQWIHLGESEVDFFTNQINNLVHGTVGPYNKGIHKNYLERQLRGLHTLEKHLSTRTFFVGERITLADVVVATLVQRAANVTIDTPTRAKLPNLFRHLETVINQPALVGTGIYGPTPVLETALVYTPPK
ncbi:glutathione S-transferase C-terminal-like protein [Mycena amicta]|nr:glutathione S-transferase C-terminal-like protein [Mycena amicta]